MLVPVILSGGSGTRLWPLSRKLLPKQFLPLVSERTMIQETVLRLAGLPDCGAPLLVAGNEQRFLAAEQMREIGARPARILLEPAGRNTAPAIAAAALVALAEDPQALLLVLPSDHAIRDLAAFHAAVAQARRAAEAGLLATFGMRPTGPETGFGYIEAGAPLAGLPGARAIKRFVEKPDEATARRFLAQGGFTWNSGMFLFGAARFLEELGAHRPAILEAVRRAVAGAERDLDFLRLEAAAFAEAPAEPVDTAVMERTRSGAVIECELGWSDVGSFATLWELGRKDAQGNVAAGDVSLTGAKGCYVRADGRHVAVLGAENLVIVETGDALLVATRERAQEVKEVVARLEREKRSEHVSHARVYRPWGYYESVDGGERFRVKRLMVKPGQALSLQRHRKRAEHWVVVSGRARVTKDGEVHEVLENESIFIPLGAKHRLENPGEEPLFVVEVQSGTYFGEDDIERFEDRYNRG
jgi:mannose-1-phosphate guanylyltransferase/mannose-6-phosphate isomerase